MKWPSRQWSREREREKERERKRERDRESSTTKARDRASLVPVRQTDRQTRMDGKTDGRRNE